MSKTKVIFPAAADIYWHDGGKAMSDVVGRLIDGPASTRDLDAWRRLAVEAVDEIKSLRARLASARKALVGIAADCHRSKWQFDLSDDHKPTAAASRALILKAFDELHRIGNVGIAAYSAKDAPNV